MPISNITQPELIDINDKLRLRKFNNNYLFAVNWYQDIETVYLVDGVKEPYSDDKIKTMYEYLNNKGELYFIEIKEDYEFIPIGDVTFWQYDLPIVIGDKKYRSKGIGKQVVKALINRAIDLGYKELYVKEIYTYNICSQRLFESLGFVRIGNTDKGFSYKLTL